MLKQAADYDTSPDVLDSLYKFMNVAQLSHPLLVPRVAELERWCRESTYATILAGTYPRLDGPADPAASVVQDAQEAYTDWKTTLNSSSDAGSQMLGKAVTEAERLFGDLLGK